MEIKELTPEMVEQLNAPLPAEAISQHPTKTYLSTIKTIYIVERLNQVFGIGHWFQRNEIMESPGKMKQVHSFLTVPEYGIALDNFGGNDNVDEGDAWKGAATDALSKMASYLGIGMDVYKGLADKGNSNHGPARVPEKKAEGTLKQKKLIADLLKRKGYTVADLQAQGLQSAKEVIDYLITAPAKISTDGNPTFTKEETDSLFDEPHTDGAQQAFESEQKSEEIDLNSPEVPFNDTPAKAALRKQFGGRA